jgi:plastocyanin
VVVAVAACGGSADQGGGGEPQGGAGQQPTKAKPVATIDVRETDFKLDPANVTVDKPGEVLFRVSNEGQTPHALEVEGPEGEVETRQLAPGDSAELTANLSKPGKYVWYCPVGDHKDRGMEGAITVAGGGSGDDKGGRGESEPGDDKGGSRGSQSEPGDDSGGSGGGGSSSY